MKFDNGKKIDLIVVILLFLLSSAIALLFKWKPLVYSIPALVLPALYLCVREKKNWAKIALAVLVFGLLFGFFFDFIVILNRGWVITGPVFQWQFFGFYPFIDDMLGFAIMTLLIVVFYEHFVDDYRSQRISHHIWRAIIPASIATALVLLVYMTNPSYLKVPYVYLVFGSVAIIRPIALGIRKPRFLSSFLKVSIFFFFIWLGCELVALANNGWAFPGQYIGTVNIAGLVFPLEELIFWMLLYSGTIVSFYECYIDER